ncbi:amidohydrolase family protein [Lysobacter humi (ex Lee et al. 2017)]
MLHHRLVLAALGLSLLAGCQLAPTQGAESTGLADAHTHLSWYGEEALAALAAAGVTAVRDCGGDVETLRRWNTEIADGSRAGPKIYMSGPAIDGPKDAKFRLKVASPQEAREAVRKLAAMRVDFIKTHNALPRDAYFAVLAEASVVGLRVASHLPKGVAAWEAADAGVDSIEHAAESLLASPIYAGFATDVDSAMTWWDSPAGDAAIRHLADRRVAVTPTLVTYAEMSELRRGTDAYDGRQRVLAFLIRLTGRLHRGGVTILAGSDFAGTELPMRPGTSLLAELALLEQAGLSRAEARKAAGANILEWVKPTGPQG